MRSHRILTVIDSHTAGHPTRTVTQGVPPLAGSTVRDKRDSFREAHDALRPLLLHEPRGHAAMVAAIPVPSAIADCGLFFVSSYVYLDMCGHATIGYVATLAALGALPAGFAADGFSIETPAGIVHVTGEMSDGDLTSVVLRNVPSYLAHQDLTLALPGEGDIPYDVAFGGTWFALVDARQIDVPFTLDHASRWCGLGAAIVAACNERPSPTVAMPTIGSVLFYRNIDGGGRHLVVLAANKFDRSPCGTGTAARLAQLHGRGLLAPGQPYRAENLLGVAFEARIADVAQADGHAAVVPEIRGMAHVTAFSTLVLEAGDPLPGGFLPR